MTREETPLVQRQEDQLGCSSRGRLRALQMIGSLEPSEKTGTFFLADPLQRVVLCLCLCVCVCDVGSAFVLFGLT